jgi:hypothetical protein
LPGITTVGCHAVAGSCRNERGGHDPTVVTVWAQIPGEPITTWPGFLDENERVSLGLEFADEVIDGGLSRPEGAEIGDLSTVVLSDIRDRAGVLMDIHADVERARLVHG